MAQQVFFREQLVMAEDSNGESHRESSAQITIDMLELGPGWVYFEAGRQQPAAAELPRFLNQTLIGWLQEHPHYRVRAAQGLLRSGHTVGLHVWYDVDQPASG